jgi:hypothetical protein
MPLTFGANDLHDMVVRAAGNALWAVLSYTGQKCVSAIRTAAKTQDSIGAIYRQSTQSLAGAFPINNQKDRDRLGGFLGSPELEALARQYFSTKLLGDSKPANPLGIRAEFTRVR